MIFLDLFSGAGGGSLGIKRALLSQQISDIYCKGHFEICKDASKILHKHWPHVPNHGSVENQNWKSFGNVDLIIAGSPCTDLSIIRNAGQTKAAREHLKGKDSKLFYDFVQAIESTKPKYFLLENVASMSNEARDEISKILGVQPIKINSSLLSAQNRERLYWCNWEVPQPKDQFIQLIDIKVRDPFKYGYSWSKSTRKHTNPIKVEFIRDNGIRSTKEHKRSYDERLRQDQKANCLTGSINGSEAMTFFSMERISGLPRKVYDRHDLLPYQLEPGTWRKLLPVECERLQTFPDGWCRGVSNTAAYRLMGKAMTVDVIKHIMSHNPEVKK